jgi:uncharacterized repeat protein (TIGR03803 family)
MEFLTRKHWPLMFLLLATAIGAVGADNFRVLHSFNGSDGAYPLGGLVPSDDGFLGTANEGGGHSAGTIFKLSQSGQMLAVHSMTSRGVGPVGELVFDETGAVYCATAYGGRYGNGAVIKFEKTGTVTVLHSFAGPPTDGKQPVAGLKRDAEGDLFGTTLFGGNVTSDCPEGCGTVFKVDKTGRETVLYRFTGGADGSLPWAPVLLNSRGTLFGTASNVVFALGTDGAYHVLHRFKAGESTVSSYGRLVTDSASNLYGTTSQGGMFNAGTVFKLDKTGHETVLYSFQGNRDGAFPFTGLTRDTSGNLYGVTEYGGSSPGTGGNGVVFKLDTAGNLTVLHIFTGSDGRLPVANLLCHETNLYGTTFQGGDSDYGVVFELEGACGAVQEDDGGGELESAQ